MAAFELSAASAPDYLAERGRPLSAQATCRELGGGVSNTVVLVEDGDLRFVLKQALPRLRVEDEWLADRSRIFRERDGLLAAARLLPAPWVPRVLWSDDDAYLYAMEAFRPTASSWKEELMAGRIDRTVARRVGVALGLTVRNSRSDPAIEKRFRDRTAFDQLRTDPYYLTVGRRHPGIGERVEEWIERSRARAVALVHGDWSPKNMMVDGERLVFIDYECAHWGDPAFDSGFVINHLALKAFHRPELADEYLQAARVVFEWTLSVLPPEILRWFEEATCGHLALLMLARIDGKSPVEYLVESGVRDRVRRLALDLIREKPQRLGSCLAAVEQSLQ